MLNDGMDERQAEAMFDKIEKFAAYGFNKSHAVEYSIISYWSQWFKIHYPAEFFAAALTILDDEKLSAIVKDAKEFGVKVLPPDVNISTDRFEIRPSTVAGERLLYAPFQRVKGISSNGTKHLLDVRRKVGDFKSIDHLKGSVTPRKFNARAIDSLDKVGAFASVEKSSAVDAQSRRRDQLELLGGLIIDHAKATRAIPTGDKVKRRIIKEVVHPMSACANCTLAGGVHPIPRMGGKAKFMVVTDCPTFSEEADNKIMSGITAEYVKLSLAAAGLKISEGYFTTLVKSPKSGPTLAGEQINGCAMYLEKELEILKPPVIVALGGETVRRFVKNLSGGPMGMVGEWIYDKELDTTIICGFNPAMIKFKPEMQAELDRIFHSVSENFKEVA